jgi:uncharacterized protein YbjT (DUF2867 family)
MPSTERIIFVTGATGHQGGAAVRHLLADGWRVRALVRDAGAPKAKELAEAGAELAVGDMADRAALDAAVAGVHGVFSVQPAATPPYNNIDEVAMGVNVADAALAAGVQHLVYTSVGAVERSAGIPSWNTKLRIEEHIRAIGVPATILRPVMFMENHASSRVGAYSDLAMLRVIPEESLVQLIAVSDIGGLAALSFADPEGWLGEVLEIAGDELPRRGIADAIALATGRAVDLSPLSPEQVAALLGGAKDVRMEAKFAGWNADIPALRKRYPALMDFGTWLEREGKSLFTNPTN